MQGVTLMVVVVMVLNLLQVDLVALLVQMELQVLVEAVVALVVQLLFGVVMVDLVLSLYDIEHNQHK